MSKKKIIYLITKSNWGGAQKYVYDLATNLPREDYEVVVATGGTGGLGATTGILVDKLKEKNIKTIFLPTFTRNIFLTNELFSFWAVFQLIKKERPDILHLNSSKAGGIGAFCGRILRVPKIIYTVHGWPFNENRSYLSKKIIYILSWLTCALSHHAITISQENYNQGRKFWGQKNKIELIYNSLKPIEFLTKTDARAHLNQTLNHPLSNEDLVIGTIAELHPNKNLATLIKATDPRQAKLVIIGEGESRPQLSSLITTSSKETAIELAGFIFNASTLLKAFDIFVLPSYKEGHPYVVLEAGQARLPVIGSDISGIRDIIKNNYNGSLFNPNRPNELKDKINYLLSHPEEKTKLGHNLEKTIKEKYTFNSFLNHTLSLYK